MRIAAGGPHPVPPASRQSAKPRPYFPPTPKAAFFEIGYQNDAGAFSSRSCGIDRSGVPMISEKRLAESSSRSAVFVLLSAAQSGAHASANASVKEIQRMDLAYYRRGAKWAKSHASCRSVRIRTKPRIPGPA